MLGPDHRSTNTADPTLKRVARYGTRENALKCSRSAIARARGDGVQFAIIR